MTSPAIEIPVLSVSGLTQSIKILLEGQFRFVAVQGEVSNCKLQASGHLYFSIKDANAQLSAVMFKGDLASVSRLPKDGDQVILKGALNVYPPTGKYQIVVRTLEMAGVGVLLLQLEALKAKLKALGYFETARKKALPKYPKTIGVVTSPTGAVIQDILNVLDRRIAGFHLILNPVKVQGPGAAQEIALAIDFFNRHALADVLIVGRGGGSLEDLWAFNEEVVASAIFRSKIPVVSAVGHETDVTLADFVADVRAPTPSAAAEIIVREKGAELQKLVQAHKTLSNALIQLMRIKKQQLSSLCKQPVMTNPYVLLGPFIQKADELKESVDRTMKEQLSRFSIKISGIKRENEALNPSKRIAFIQEKLRYLSKTLDHAWKKRNENAMKNLKQVETLLGAIDPRRLLKQGYSIIFSEIDHSIIKSVHSLSVGENVKILLGDGEAHSTINRIGNT